MKRNPPVNSFSDDTRSLFIFETACWACGSNQNLEADHILGRVSNSPFNLFLMCRKCHTNKSHSEDKERLKKTKDFLDAMGYEPTEEDKKFLKYADKRIPKTD